MSGVQWQIAMMSVDSTGEGRLLDLDGSCLLSIPNSLMGLLLLWTLCVVALALPVPSAAWHLVIGIACVVGLLVYGLCTVGSQDAAAQRRSSKGQGAVGPAP